MYLKKFYDEADLQRYQAEKDVVVERAKAKYKAMGITDEDVLKVAIQKEVDKAGILQPKIDYISLAHTGTSLEQHFATQMVTEYVSLGLMEIHDDELFFHVHPETLRYMITGQPGRYCAHCGEKLPDDEKGDLARLHIALKHNGVRSLDPSNPSGYEDRKYLNVTLSAEQHEKYKAVPGTVAYRFPEKVG